MLSEIGLALIAFGWLLQMARSCKGNNTISPNFLLIYCAGAGLLAISGYLGGASSMAALNTIALIIALLIFFKTGKKAKNKN